MSAQPNENVAMENWVAFDAAWAAGHSDYVKHADKCDNFYVGDQWDDATLAKLGGRPALTINLALRTINALKGTYSSTRADLMFKPSRNAVEDQAQVLTRLVDQVLESNMYSKYVEPMLFDDGLVADRGFLDVRMNYDDNMLGEIHVTARDPRTVLLSPQASEYHPDEWPEIITTEWWSPDDIELMYGKEKADLLKGYIAEGQYFGANSIRFGGTRADHPYAFAGLIDERQLRSVRIIDRQYKKIGKVREFVDLETGDTRVIPDHFTDDRIEFIKERYGMGVRERLAKRVRWCVSADHVTLWDGWSPYKDFTIIPFFPYFRRGKPAGVMKQLLSPQEQLNKTESQMLHIVNTTANSGWAVEAGSLVNMSTEELEERGAETGLVLVYGRGRMAPAKIQPNQIPTGLDRIAGKAGAFIAEIPGVNPLIGQELKSDVAAAALNGARTTALAGQQPIFDNLNLTRSILGDRILKLVQGFYTEPRLLRVTDWRAPEQESIQFEINTDALNNITIGEYDLVVSNAPARDTFEETQFSQAMAMREAGVTIPDHYLILSSHLAQKREIAELVKRLQGFGEPTEEESMLAKMQQELTIRMLWGELAKLEADVHKLHAEAGLAEAKAGAVGSEAEIKMHELVSLNANERQKMLNDMLKKAADLQNKIVLADKHIGAKIATTRYQAQMKAVIEDKKLKAKPKPAAKPKAKKKKSAA